MTPEEATRYSRQIILPDFGTEGQARLKRSKVLVIGMGGLGSPASLYLAAAGVGTLGICDFDKVDLSNLHRQVLHGSESVGRSKIDSARERLQSVNPEVEIRAHPEGVTVDNAVELFREYDIIVDGCDNFPTRYLNNDAAFFAGKPLVYGSIFQFEGQLTVFHPAEGSPCYRCLFPQMPEPGTVPNCAEAGVLGALPGIIGSLQAMEAIKWITQCGKAPLGRLLVYDALRTRFQEVSIKPDPTCPLCGERANIQSIQPENYEWACEVPDPNAMSNDSNPMEINVAEARQKQAAGIRLLDVREAFERDICSIEGAHAIPMKEIPHRLSELDPQEPLLVYCHHGMRSLRAVQYLREWGFEQAQSMIGGIEAWANEVEPDMRRY